MAKVKNFFKKVGLWFKNHAPTKRRLIQIYAALLYNANIKGYINGRIYTGGAGSGGSGGTKNLCVPGLNCYSCPGAIGSCPLGALQDSLAHSNETAPLYILGILGLLGLIFARTVCGFLCPVGLGQELLYKIKTPKLGKSRYTRFLSYFKYILLAVFVIAIPLIYNGIPAFCKYVCPAGTFGGAGGLLSNPENAGYFDQLGILFSWKFCLLIAFIVACIFIYRCFCRFFCPLGAIYGFFNRIALIGVKLDEKKCVDCGACIQTCKMDIKHVGDHECINCGECIPVCPTKAISWKGGKLVLAGIDTSVPEEEKPALNIPLKATVSANAAVQDGGSNEAVAAEVAVQDGKQERIEAVKAKIKKRSFWLQFSAWALALAVLVGALVFYNFIDKAEVGSVTPSVYTVGDTCPDFELTTVYDTAGGRDENGELLKGFKLSDCEEGTVTVLNFWYTLCDPCIEELPDFKQAKELYGDKVNICVIHINNGVPDSAVQKKIENLGWTDWNLIFAHDSEESIYTALGGKDICPMTVILDAENKITFSYTGKLSGFNQLKDNIDKAFAD